jgi:hypothetical protein
VSLTGRASDAALVTAAVRERSSPTGRSAQAGWLLWLPGGSAAELTRRAHPSALVGLHGTRLQAGRLRCRQHLAPRHSSDLGAPPSSRHRGPKPRDPDQRQDDRRRVCRRRRVARTTGTGSPLLFGHRQLPGSPAVITWCHVSRLSSTRPPPVGRRSNDSSVAVPPHRRLLPPLVGPPRLLIVSLARADPGAPVPSAVIPAQPLSSGRANRSHESAHPTSGNPL